MLEVSLGSVIEMFNSGVRFVLGLYLYMGDAAWEFLFFLEGDSCSRFLTSNSEEGKKICRIPILRPRAQRSISLRPTMKLNR